MRESCECPERKKPVHERAWVIRRYKYNTSAFNGGHYTPSDYSDVECRSCGSIWRTKAGYVDHLKHMDGD